MWDMRRGLYYWALVEECMSEQAISVVSYPSSEWKICNPFICFSSIYERLNYILEIVLASLRNVCLPDSTWYRLEVSLEISDFEIDSFSSPSSIYLKLCVNMSSTKVSAATTKNALNMGYLKNYISQRLSTFVEPFWPSVFPMCSNTSFYPIFILF